jgi:hypothetical protein
MPSTMSLNTRIHIVSKSGKKESISARELIARGSGNTFEAFKMLDEYDELANAYKAEMRFHASEKDREDHLPFGAHLLPDDYQDFLYSWNKTIANTPGCGWWNGIGRDVYKINHKPAWKQWVAKNKEFRALYAVEVQQLIAYQTSHTMEESEDEDDEDDEDYEEHEEEQEQEEQEEQEEQISQPPSLPPSLMSASDSEESDDLEQIKAKALDIMCNYNYAGTNDDRIIHDFCDNYLIPYLERNPRSALIERVKEKTPYYAGFPIAERIRIHLSRDTIGLLGYVFQHLPTMMGRSPTQGQVIPQFLPAQELSGLTEQPDTDGEDETDEADTDGEDETDAPPLTKRSHNPNYTNSQWQSPIPKLFVQHMRGPTWTSAMRSQWYLSGNTELKLTHDRCIRYLAYRMGRITPSKLLDIDPRVVHAKLIGEYSGVTGFYGRRY